MRGETLHLRYTGVREFDRAARILDLPLSFDQRGFTLHALMTQKFSIPDEGKFVSLFLPQGPEVDILSPLGGAHIRDFKEQTRSRGLEEGFYREVFRQSMSSRGFFVEYKGSKGSRRDNFKFHSGPSGLGLIKFCIKVRNYSKYNFNPILERGSSDQLMGLYSEDVS